jgi:hypothetical protein
MSLPDDDLPDPDEFRREMAKVDNDLAVARRLIGQLLMGDRFQEWIDSATMSQLDVAEADRREIDGE